MKINEAKLDFLVIFTLKCDLKLNQTVQNLDIFTFPHHFWNLISCYEIKIAAYYVLLHYINVIHPLR